MTEGDSRREQILKLLTNSPAPVSGSELAAMLNVSRQVIVQDIALLRVVNKNILSTNKGYVLYQQAVAKPMFKRSFRVSHEDSRILEELLAIVECGGRILDVVVEHEIYGQITVDLMIAGVKDAKEFTRKLSACKTKPLKELTDGVHYHTVEAESVDILDRIEAVLKEKGFFV